MNRARLAELVLVVDGLGCAAAAVALGCRRDLAEAVGAGPGARWAAVTALGATAAGLLHPGVTGPARPDLTRAAVINIGWVAVCSYAAYRRPTHPRRALLLATAGADGLAAMAQWALRTSISPVS